MPALRRWLTLGHLPAALLGVALFFPFYNRFILDANLRNLSASLSILDAATGVGQAEAALLLVDQTLLEEVSREEMNLRTLATLQYVQGTVGSDRSDRPVEDAQIFLATVREERTEERSRPLARLDQLVVGLQGGVQGILLIPRRLAAQPGSDEMDPIRLAQAIRAERGGRSLEAAQAYERLITDFPRYAGRDGLKLRLGQVHERLQDLTSAGRLYREVLRTSTDPQLIGVAGTLLNHLRESRSQMEKAQELERKLQAAPTGALRQEVAYQLGSARTRFYALEQASDAFRQAAEADPEGELATPALFKQAWCLGAVGQGKQALVLLERIARRDPAGPWGSAARLQMAQIHRSAGQYAAALEAYEKAVETTRDHALAALALGQAGNTALLDLNDPDRARGYFKRLEQEYPASPFSTIEKELVRIQAAKTGRQVEADEPSRLPVFGWLESKIPLFVQIFADRLARTMDVAGEEELVRQFTEEELRRMVLQRVQELSPGQIQDAQVSIEPEGYLGSATLRVGPLTFPVEGSVGIRLEEDRPLVAIQRVKVLGINVPEGPLRELEGRINRKILQMRLPLKVTEYRLRDGYAVIRVERVK